MTLLGLERRRAGNALLAFGVVGVILAGVIALALVGTAIATRDLDDRLQADQARLAETLDELAVTTAAAVTSIENASATLDTSSAAVLDARSVLDELATASDSLADSLGITIFGNQPFAGAAQRFRTFSDRVRVFSEDATGIADAIATNSDDMSTLADRVALMETHLGDYAERVAGSERIGQIGTWVAVSVLLGGLLAAWLAVAAGACAWVGWKLRSA
jgi:C4-dicarboxylate-specific signal transduction histidine kinase